MNKTNTTNKVKVKYVSINSNGWPCYVTEQGTYIAKIGEDYYILNQYPEEGYVGVEGEPMSKAKKDVLEFVETFD